MSIFVTKDFAFSLIFLIIELIDVCLLGCLFVFEIGADFTLWWTVA